MDDGDDDLVYVFIPSLVATLLNAEQNQDSPLTKTQVESIRDGSECRATPKDVAVRVQESRGYEDLDPERIWEQWQVAREELLPEKDYE